MTQPNLDHLKGEFIYLASPYTHADPIVRELRFLQASKATAWVINTLRVNAFGAITHTQALVTRFAMPVEWEVWAEYDTAFITHAKEVWVLCLPGWTNSMGVTTEKQIANSLGRRIRFMIPQNQTYQIVDTEPSESELYGIVEPGRLGHPPFKVE